MSAPPGYGWLDDINLLPLTIQAQLAQIEQALRAGSDMILYMHQPASPEFGTFLDNVAALVTTYNARVSSIGEWGNRIASAPGIAA